MAQKLNFPPLCHYLNKLKFFSSEIEAYRLTPNSALLSQSPRIYKVNTNKTILFYEGRVTSQFGFEQILARNSGLVFGYIHTDMSFYPEISRLLPTLQQQGLKAIYIEIPNSFSSLFENFNKKIS